MKIEHVALIPTDVVKVPAYSLRVVTDFDLILEFTGSEGVVATIVKPCRVCGRLTQPRPQMTETSYTCYVCARCGRTYAALAWAAPDSSEAEGEYEWGAGEHLHYLVTGRA